MSSHHDTRTLRIEKQLASSLGMLRRATAEAEALASQDLSDDLHDLIAQFNAVHTQLAAHGRRYKQQLPTVRI